jgi:hypothetical protein
MVDLTVGTIDAKDRNRLAIVKYLSDRTLEDETLEEACKKPNKTLDGVMNYVLQEARKLAFKNCAMVEDDTVYNWVIHYITEDSLDCEPKPEPVRPNTSVTDYLAKWRAEHPTPVTPSKPVDTSGQLMFEF